MTRYCDEARVKHTAHSSNYTKYHKYICDRTFLNRLKTYFCETLNMTSLMHMSRGRPEAEVWAGSSLTAVEPPGGMESL